MFFLLLPTCSSTLRSPNSLRIYKPVKLFRKNIFTPVITMRACSLAVFALLIFHLSWASEQFSIQSKANPFLIDRISNAESIRLLLSKPGDLANLVRRSYEKFSALLPSIVSFFSDSCLLEDGEIELEIDNIPRWNTFRDLILEQASIEHVQLVLRNEKLRLLMRQSDWPILIWRCSVRSCFKIGDLAAQQREAEILVQSGIST